MLQEIICTLQKEKGIRGYLAIKLDLEKFYDRLEWDFIENTLSFFQILNHLGKLIMDMVCSTKFSGTWNGVNLSEFVPSRGIRQYDPLSPLSC